MKSLEQTTIAAEQHILALVDKNFGKTEDHTPVQAQIHKETLELNENEKLNLQKNSKSLTILLERLSWMNTLL